MIHFAGSIKGKARHPYVYAIAKRHCLYIGETQRHPVSRWGQHLTSFGSFQKRLREADADVWASEDVILFFCMDCDKIATLSNEEHKIVTQYVEHKVHEKCILNLPLLAPIEMIISDTEKTAPSRCRYSWGDVLAERVFEKIHEQIKAHYK